MKSVSIKIKIIIFTIVVLALGTFAVELSINKSYKKNVHSAAEQSIKNAQKSFESLLENDVRMLHSNLHSLSLSEPVRAAFVAKDTSKLFSIAEPVFAKLKADAGITHWYFINNAPDSRCLLRVHNKAMHSDEIKRFTYKNAVSTNAFSAGIELGKTAFALRAVTPFYAENSDSVVGFMELGEEIEHIFKTMKTQTGDEYGVLVQKKFLNEKDWASVRTNKGLENNWNQFSDFLVVDMTSDDAHLVEIKTGLDSISEQGIVLETVEQDGKHFVRGMFPLYAADKTKVGAVFILHDVTEAYLDMKATEMRVLTAVGITMLVIILLFIFVLNKLIFKKLDNIVSVATRVVGGDFEKQIIPGEQDEIGKFESLFEQFRQVFVNMLKEHDDLLNKK